MAPKIKGLEYQSNEPAFLQRIRAGVPGTGEKHERPLPRPRRAKVDDGEDAPTYVLDETNDTVSRAEYEQMVANDVSSKDKNFAVTNTNESGGVVGPDGQVAEMSGALPAEDAQHRHNVPHAKTNCTIMGQRKRKAAAVVGQIHENEDVNPLNEQGDKPRKQGKKRSKPIKLSFDNDQR